MLIVFVISVFTFSYTVYDLQIAIGKRDQQQVLKIIESVDYNSLPIDFKCEVIIAYTELYIWGRGDVGKYQEISRKLVDELLNKEREHWKVYYVGALVYGHYVEKNLLLGVVYAGKIFDLAEKAVRYGEDQYLAHLLYGVLHLETPIGNLEKAKFHLSKSLELNPQHIYTYYLLGKYYEKIGNYCKAKELYNKVLELPGMEIWEAINREAKAEAKKRLTEIEQKQ